jgi:hypothetical protein
LLARRVDPSEMLAGGHFGQRFRPKAMTSRSEGDRATVEVTGDEPQSERAIVRCVRVSVASPSGGEERRAWRVEPELPEVLTLPHRGDPSAP